MKCNICEQPAIDGDVICQDHIDQQAAEVFGTENWDDIIEQINEEPSIMNNNPSDLEKSLYAYGLIIGTAIIIASVWLIIHSLFNGEPVLPNCNVDIKC